MKTPILLLICVVLASCSVRPDKPVNIPEVSNVYDKPWYSGYLDIPFENFKAHRPCWQNSADLTKFTDKLKQFLRTKKID